MKVNSVLWLEVCVPRQGCICLLEIRKLDEKLLYLGVNDESLPSWVLSSIYLWYCKVSTVLIRLRVKNKKSYVMNKTVELLHRKISLFISYWCNHTLNNGSWNPNCLFCFFDWMVSNFCWIIWEKSYWSLSPDE